MTDKLIEGTENDGSTPGDRTLGKLHRTRNLDRRFGSGRVYWRVMVVHTDEERYETLLLTEADLRRLRERAKKNPEDCLEPSWADRLRAE